jgi:protocatechuate 3,4-dioxygenase beta subunit
MTARTRHSAEYTIHFEVRNARPNRHELHAAEAIKGKILQLAGRRGVLYSVPLFYSLAWGTPLVMASSGNRQSLATTEGRLTAESQRRLSSAEKLVWFTWLLSVALFASFAFGQISGGGVGSGGVGGAFSGMTPPQVVNGPVAPGPPVTPTSQPVRYTLSGTVVNSITAEPVAHALVLVSAINATFSDQNGQFSLEGLTEGSYQVQVSKPGYQSPWVNGGEPEMIKVGPDGGSASLKLIPEGLITGQVVDESGDGLPRVQVQATCARVNDGRKQWQQCASAMTDEDGEFRLPHLTPGPYYLMASQFPMPREAEGDSTEQRKGYRPVYLPAVRDAKSHGTMEVQAGARLRVQLHMKKEPVFDIYGMVSGIPANTQASLELKTSDGDNIPTDAQVEQASGTFVVHGVPAGTYKLRAFGQRMLQRGGAETSIAEIPVSVGAHDVTDVTLAMRPALTIPVTVRLETTHPDSESRIGTMALNGGQVPPNTPVVQVCLNEVSGTARNYCSIPEMKDGQLTIELRGVEPGQYTAHISGMGMMIYASAASYDGADVLHDTLTVKPGSNAATLEVTVRDDMAQLKCGIRKVGSVPYWLLVEDESGQQSFTQRLIGGGGESLMMLPPGKYKVYAFDHMGGLEFHNPEAMRDYSAKAVDVDLAPSDQRSLKLDVIARSAQ